MNYPVEAKFAANPCVFQQILLILHSITEYPKSMI